MWLSSAKGQPRGSVFLLVLPWTLLTWPLTSPHPWSMALVLLGLSTLIYNAYIRASPASQGCWENPLRPEAEG